MYEARALKSYFCDVKRMGILSVSLLLVLQLAAGRPTHASNGDLFIRKSSTTSFRKGVAGKLTISLFDGNCQLQDLFLNSLPFSPHRNIGSECSVYFNQLAAPLSCRNCERYSLGTFLHHSLTQKIIFPFHYFW